jgi:hypothetical protein
MWNCAFGIGPTIDGTAPAALKPSLQALGEFTSWAGEAIYGTTGAIRNGFVPGWMDGGASGGYYSATTPLLGAGRTVYLLVTTAPSSGFALFRSSRPAPKSVTDLRTGVPHPFSCDGGLRVECEDWRDVERYGAKVFKVEF